MSETIPAGTPAALTPDQALAILGKGVISRGGFYKALRRGDIPHLRLGKLMIIPRAAFYRWLDSAGHTTDKRT